MSDTGSGAPALTLKTATSQEADVAQIQTMAAKLDQLRAQVSRKIVGQEEVVDGKVIGWFNGRAEFGPRALGGRSIIVDPSRSDAKDLLNSKIKRRESFRCGQFDGVFYDIVGNGHFPYMVLKGGDLFGRKDGVH